MADGVREILISCDAAGCGVLVRASIHGPSYEARDAARDELIASLAAAGWRFSWDAGSAICPRHAEASSRQTGN